MRFVRSGRRVAVAAVSLSALLVAAACGSSSGTSSGTGSSAPAVDLTAQGDIELWQGKDVSGNLVKQLGGTLIGYLFIIEIPFLKGRDKLEPGVPVVTLLDVNE